MLITIMSSQPQAELMEKFAPAIGCGLEDFVTVYDKDDVRFAFKEGRAVKP